MVHYILMKGKIVLAAPAAIMRSVIFYAIPDISTEVVLQDYGVSELQLPQVEP